MVEEDRTYEYTDLQNQFLDLIKKYPVKNPETIVDYVSSQGETVLEDPEKLADSLSECEITPVRRRQILKHWFADKGVEVPSELLRKAAFPHEERRKLEQAEDERKEREKSKYSIDTETGAIKVASTTDKTALTWDEAQQLSKTVKKEISDRGRKTPVTYVYDTQTAQVRMTKEGETGGTMEQAKELKRMAEEGARETGESPFTIDEGGNWRLNPKAKVTGIELMAYDSMRRAQERGEALTPLEAMQQATEQMKIYREVFTGGQQQMPPWMTDPAAFIQTIRTIVPEQKGDDAVKTELAELRQTLREMQEERHKQELATLQAQIKAQAEAHQKQIQDISDKIQDMGKTTVGRTEMDIIHEVASEGIGVIKTEAAGMRTMLRDMVAGTGLPAMKTPQEREGRKTKYRQALQADKEMEELGRKIFFGEGRQ